MLVADPGILLDPESTHAALAWNLAYAYSAENRFWTRSRAARAGVAWALDPVVGALVRFRVVRVVAW